MKLSLLSALGSLALTSFSFGQALERFRVQDSSSFVLDPAISVYSLNDVDGDGADDILVGGETTSGVVQVGRARVYSGRLGTLLYSVTLPVLGRVRLVGDLTGDGICDFGFTLSGAVYPELHLFSGSDGSPLFEIVRDPALYPPGSVGVASAFSGYGAWGGKVAGIGDVNNDGIEDIAVAAIRDYLTVWNQGMVYVYSGADGTFLYSQAGLTINSRFGNSIAALGDVNGDGKDDFLVGAPSTNSNGLDSKGACFVCSGVDGSFLSTVIGSQFGDYLGFRVLALSDHDGDGAKEFAALTSQSLLGSESEHYFRVYSGANGSLRYEVGIPKLSGSYLYGWDTIEDVNQDGFVDMLICQASDNAFPSSTAIGNFPGTGRVLVVSGLGGTILDMQEADVPNTSVGSVAGLNDLDGNGMADYVVGSYPRPGFVEGGTVQVMQLGCPSTSVPSCVNTPNSTGMVGEMETVACGTAVDQGLLQVRLTQLPPNSFGFLMISNQPRNIALGNATLCLGGRITRLNTDATGIFKSDSVGFASQQIDWATFPSGATVQPGAVRYIQSAHRDSGSSQGFHLTNAVELMF